MTLTPTQFEILERMMDGQLHPLDRFPETISPSDITTMVHRRLVRGCHMMLGHYEITDLGRKEVEKHRAQNA